MLSGVSAQSQSLSQSSPNGFSVETISAVGNVLGAGSILDEKQDQRLNPVTVTNKIILGADARFGRSSSSSPSQFYGGWGRQINEVKQTATYTDVYWSPTASTPTLPDKVMLKMFSQSDAKIVSSVPFTWSTTLEIQGGWGEETQWFDGTNHEGYVRKRSLKIEPRLLTFSTAGGTWLSSTQYRFRIALNKEFLARVSASWPSGGGQQSAKISTYVSANTTVDNRSVRIDSPTIETSYRFGETDNSSGYPTNPKTPRVRDSSGAIETDSVAKWLYDRPNGTPVGSWYGGGVFTPNFTGYSSVMPGRTFTWSLQGGSGAGGAAPIFDGQIGGSLPIDVGPRYVNPVTPADVPADGSSITGIYLGGQQYGKPLTKQSTIKLKVKDGGGVAGDGAVAENTFTINWHAPAEGYEFQSQLLTPDPLTMTDADTGGTTVNAGLALSYALRPNQTDWDIPKVASSGSSILGAAGSAAVIFGIATDGIGFAVVGLLAAAGSTYGASVQPAPDPTKYPVPTGYALYRSNLTTQVGTGFDTGNYSDGTPRVDASTANLTLMENAPANELADEYWNGTKGSFQVKGRLQRNKRTRNWKYKEYDEHGFVGLTPAHTYDWIIIRPELTYVFKPKTTL